MMFAAGKSSGPSMCLKNLESLTSSQKRQKSRTVVRTDDYLADNPEEQERTLPMYMYVCYCILRRY